MKTQKQRMLSGELYQAMDAELAADRARCEALLLRYNGGEHAALRELLGGIGERSEVRAPFFCDYGKNITLGSGVFLNFNCILLDVMPIVIGDGTQIGPGVQIYAADHPREADVRREGWELGRAVTIGRNAWIGGGALILPGVVVGDDAIIGAGSVVTRDVPAGATVMGNPARIK
jgi:maltose O-acetyltransferase